MKENYDQYLDRLASQRLIKKINTRRLGNVLVIASFLGFQHLSFSFYTAQQTRKQVFNDEWVK